MGGIRPVSRGNGHNREEDRMHTLATLFATFLMMSAKIAFETRPSEKPLTPERLIRMGAGN
jgi:hypothetical protein